jgi:hypothetical protein
MFLIFEFLNEQPHTREIVRASKAGELRIAEFGAPKAIVLEPEPFSMSPFVSTENCTTFWSFCALIEFQRQCRYSRPARIGRKR